MDKEKSKFVPKEKMEFTFRNIKYVVGNNLTVEQMEVISEMLDEQHNDILQRFLTLDIRTLENVQRIAGTITEILQKIRKSGKLCKMVAYAATPEGQEWDRVLAEKNAELFKKLDYKTAEDVFGFFFTGGILQKILLPSFFTEASPPETTPSEISSV